MSTRAQPVLTQTEEISTMSNTVTHAPVVSLVIQDQPQTTAIWSNVQKVNSASWDLHPQPLQFSVPPVLTHPSQRLCLSKIANHVLPVITVFNPILGK